MTALAPDALEANRAGKLTDAQRKNYRSMSRGTRGNELYFAVVCTILGLLVWFAPGPASYATTKPLVGIAFLVIAGALFVRAFLGADAMTRDVRNGRVESLEGAVTKWANTTHVKGSSSTTYHVKVGEVRAETNAQWYQSIPEAGMVRIYYLPVSHRLINLEQLADRPLPQGAMTDPTVALRDAKQAFRGNADARAELAAIGNAMKGQFSADGSPPPASARDSRPLAQAILGTWRNPMITLVFDADGTASMTSSMGGMRQQGHWSVDANGRLVADVAGATEGVDAWIVGGRLTVVMGGQSISLQRAG
ncbi:MAG TPA: hypothetical protein VJT78_05030 [Candidatus Dormibacteraeota bacterium]|nr:hypothetical protein [Candidatus Dormibacteraeota bacterium]